MPDQAHSPDQILRKTCQVTQARWAAWVERADTEWRILTRHTLSSGRLKALSQFILEPANAAWLDTGLAANKVRTCQCGGMPAALGCAHLRIYPQSGSRYLLMVGFDHLDQRSDGFWKVISLHPPDVNPVSLIAESQPDYPLWPLDSVREPSFDPQQSLDTILDYLRRLVPCESAYLAVRSGDSFHIQATVNCVAALSNFDLTISENLSLSMLVSNQQGLILSEAEVQADLTLKRMMRKTTRAWLGVPILIGRRVIGIVVFAASTSGVFTQQHLQATTSRVSRLAYSVENAIIFNEVTRYLQQLALLNELASTAALSMETIKGRSADEFARRVMQRLRRAFDTDWAAVLLLSADGKTLLESGGGSLTGPPWVVSVDNSLMGKAVMTGQPIRSGDLPNTPGYFPLRPGLRSELAVPLKYRSRVIGALVLISKEANAFTAQDEQLLVVIASQLAGLFENARLNEETLERAKKLADSVRQLQAVRDTSLDIAGDLDLNTLLARVAQRARDLVGARGAELGLYIPDEEVIEIVASNTPWENYQGLKVPLMSGVAGQMAVVGEPFVIHDYNTWPGRLVHEQTSSFKAVAGVPLKFKGQVIGTLTVLDDRPDKVFQEEDVRLLELLAPQAAISIRNARLYQELETRIQAQQLAESRLIRSARLAAVGEMAAGVAHELNNPLTTVTGFVELVLEELPDDSPHKSELRLVLQEAYRARSVVRHLLDFSRPAEEIRMNADVNEVIQQVLPLVTHLAATSNIIITTHLEPGLPWLLIDPNQIKQVILNMIHNGLQAMPRGGMLTLRTACQPTDNPPLNAPAAAWVTIEISDTGEGIAPENLELIFEPFFTTRPAGKGTGLGLSVSYGIISDHGGTIEVDSQPGMGSKFTIHLPVPEGETA